jgi:prepilin-type N-terminal cleavage/methylation domain-containing protein
MTDNQNKKSGFTLVETMVSVVIFAMLIYGISLLVSGILTQSGFQSRILDSNDQARKVATGFTNEVRGSVVSATGSFPIEIASDQQIAFYTKTATTINRIRYYLQGGVLYKGVTVPTGNPAVYNLAQEVVTPVQTAMATGPTDVIFTYYDDSENVLTQPVNITHIRKIGVTLKIYLQGSKNKTNTYTVEASATVRNLKDNL